MSVKALSRMLLGVGLILIVFAIFKDVSYGGVYNLHKASQQSNQLILGGFIFLAGIISMVASRSRDSGEIGAQESALPQAAQSPSLSIQPTQPEFAGEMDISSPPYQLFLTRQFSIEKNATLEKYVIGDDVFDTLEQSLREADDRYQAKLSEIKAEEEKVRREKEESEQKLATENAQQSERNALEKAERERLEIEQRPIREAQRKQMAFAGGGVVLLILIFFVAFQIAQNKRTAALEKQKLELSEERAKALNQTYLTRMVFGYSLGDQNQQLITDQLKGYGSNFDTDSVWCSDDGCNGLKGFATFVPAVHSVTFSFCSGRLNRVTLIYNDADLAINDLAILKSVGTASNGGIAAATPAIARDSAKVLIQDANCYQTVPIETMN